MRKVQVELIDDVHNVGIYGSKHEEVIHIPYESLNIMVNRFNERHHGYVFFSIRNIFTDLETGRVGDDIFALVKNTYTEYLDDGTQSDDEDRAASLDKLYIEGDALMADITILDTQYHNEISRRIDSNIFVATVDIYMRSPLPKYDHPRFSHICEDPYLSEMSFKIQNLMFQNKLKNDKTATLDTIKTADCILVNKKTKDI